MEKTILIVEDDPDIAECLQYNLELANFQTKVAHTGWEGLSVLLNAEKRPALVLLDLNLPDLDGLEICRRVRATVEIQRIPIVMLTAYASDVDQARGLAAGVNTYITKPYSMRDVVSTIQGVLTASIGLADPAPVT